MFRYSRRVIWLGSSIVLSALLWGCATTSAPPPASADCPQPKFTGRAPDAIYNQKNPLQTAEVDPVAGKRLFFDDEPNGKRFACATCHGRNADGKGPMATQFNPPPRHLGCVNIASITDGQVFWIIRNGSAGTEMPAHKNFTDKEVWQLVAYLRALRFGT